MTKVRTRAGRKLNRLERAMMIFKGDRKTISSKVAFGMNILMSVLSVAGVSIVIANANADNKLEPKNAAAGVALGAFGYINGSEVYRKSGTDYWWVEEKGSARKKGAKK